MEKELTIILTFLQHVHHLWTLHMWEREAAKALRRLEPYTARIAFAHIDELTKEV